MTSPQPIHAEPCPVPVQCVALPRSGLTVPRIGIGLAHLHLLDKNRQARLVDTALALGLTHFDTAAFYGDGLSERVLGQLLGSRRGAATITTKFGLMPTSLIGRMGVAAPIGRKLRSAMVRLGLTRYPRGLYTPALLQRSLARSLRALRTDYVDVLAIHEPPDADGVSDELIDALVAVKRAGHARLIGVAGDRIDAIVARWGGVLDIIQTAEARWSEERFTPDFTYSVFTAGRERGDPPLTAQEADSRLTRALARRPSGAVIVQTGDPQRLQHYADLAAQ